MNKDKKVSVVMSTFNGDSKGGYIWEQLDSVLNQTYPVLEIIIQDDCSVDRTWELLQEYAKKSSLIKLYHNERNLGCGNSFVSAWNKASGDYIVVCDDDDIWMPNKIQILVDVIGDKMFAIGQSRVIRESNFESYYLCYEELNPHTATIEKLIFGNCVGGGQQMMFDRKMLNDINDIKSENIIVPDYLLALIAYYYNSVAITDEITQWFRINSKSTSGKTFNYVEVGAKWKKIKGYKVLYSIYCLIIGRKSSKVDDCFMKINQVVKVLRQKSPNIKSQKLVSFTELMRKQTFLSYMRASIICYGMKRELFNESNWSTRKNLNALIYIYKWWYNHRHDC
jgi:glycosyltransferase involved in cell wall biosynthesis